MDEQLITTCRTATCQSVLTAAARCWRLLPAGGAWCAPHHICS
jgi:hypothetical protein